MNRTKLHEKILWITETAVMLALLVAVQGVTSSLNNQILTGSCVNLILAVTTLMVGCWGGIAVAAVSPFMAFLFGIGPKFIQLLPAIAAGNMVLVLVLGLMLGKKNQPIWKMAVAWLASAVAKFGTLYLLMTQFLVPALVSGGVVPQKAAANLMAQFSWPQLITALIGGAVALVIAPVLRKALRK